VGLFPSFRVGLDLDNSFGVVTELRQTVHALSWVNVGCVNGSEGARVAVRQMICPTRAADRWLTRFTPFLYRAETRQ
jgi:hypothetical protein